MPGKGRSGLTSMEQQWSSGPEAQGISERVVRMSEEGERVGNAAESIVPYEDLGFYSD